MGKAGKASLNYIVSEQKFAQLHSEAASENTGEIPLQINKLLYKINPE